MESHCGAYSSTHKNTGGSHPAPAHVSYNKRFAIVISINTLYVIIEVVSGKKLGSAALMADGLHNLTDVIGLMTAWLGFFLAQKKPTNKFTFGFKKATILASFINAITVFIGVIYVFIEAFLGVFNNFLIPAKEVIIIAGAGIIINGFTAILFFSGSKSDLNIKGAFLHLLFDAVVSLGVVFAGILMIIMKLPLIDSITGFIIAGIIIATSWSFFIESGKLLLNGVPNGILIEEIEEALLQIEGVVSFHDLHVWAISTNQNALSAHIRFNYSARISKASDLLKKIEGVIRGKFNISHITIQLEEQENDKCFINC